LSVFRIVSTANSDYLEGDEMAGRRRKKFEIELEIVQKMVLQSRTTKDSLWTLSLQKRDVVENYSVKES
jgi:hypothetical protein